MLSITSDYVESYGDPQPYLERIAAAGFTHVHWCHHWNTDFLYSEPEIAQIERWFAEYGLRLLNLHASQGKEKYWCSFLEYQRQAGVELVQNRIRMAARLGADVVIIHVPSSAGEEVRAEMLGPVRRSLAEVVPTAKRLGVRVAVENMESDDFGMLTTLLNEYDADALGLCYDSGHGNVDGRGLENLEKVRDRLIALHLHDNDGADDQHNLPFTGTVDWERLARIIAASPYDKCLNLEVIIQNSGLKDEAEFLRQAHAYRSKNERKRIHPQERHEHPRPPRRPGFHRRRDAGEVGQGRL
jgi:sugar phosphate isomerase/epimerase